MKHTTLSILAAILFFSVIPAAAQFDALKKNVKEKTKTDQTQEKSSQENGETTATPDRSKDAYDDTDFLFMGKNGMDGETTDTMKACVPGLKIGRAACRG